MPNEMEMEDEDAPKFQKLVRSVEYFFQLFKEGRVSEILVRVAIFVALVILTHTIMIWFIYNILIPLAKRYFVDRMLSDIQKRVGSFSWNGHKLTDYDLDF